MRFNDEEDRDVVISIIRIARFIYNETIVIRVIYYSGKIWNHLETIMVRLIYYSGKIIVSRNVYFSLWINVSHDNAPLNCDR